MEEGASSSTSSDKARAFRREVFNSILAIVATVLGWTAWMADHPWLGLALLLMGCSLWETRGELPPAHGDDDHDW